MMYVFREAWHGYVRGHFLSSKQFVLLEVTVSREVAKSPKAIESIFAGIHGASKDPNLIETYWDGFCNSWFSFEIVGDGSGVSNPGDDDVRWQDRIRPDHGLF